MEGSRSTRFKGVRTRVVTVLVTMLAGAVLVACGSSSKTTSSSGSSSAPASSSSGPGAGKPSVTLGSKNFAESNIIGQLYAQALRAKGYSIKLKSEIGSTELIYKALRAGQIDVYAEYTGVLLSAVAEQSKAPAIEQQAYKQAQPFVEKEGNTLLYKTPYFDTNLLITPPNYAI